MKTQKNRIVCECVTQKSSWSAAKPASLSCRLFRGWNMILPVWRGVVYLVHLVSTVIASVPPWSDLDWQRSILVPEKAAAVAFRSCICSAQLVRREHAFAIGAWTVLLASRQRRCGWPCWMSCLMIQAAGGHHMKQGLSLPVWCNRCTWVVACMACSS